MQLYLKQKVFSIGDKFTFYDQNGNVFYKAKGSIFAIPKRYTLYSGDGTPQLLVKRKFWSFMPKYSFFELPSNHEFASMKQNFALSKRFEISTTNGKFRIDGTIWGYSFNIVNENELIVASVKKSILSWGDTYEFDIDENLIYPKLACGIMIAYDCAIHSNNN